MANSDPKGMVGRIYEGDCLSLLHTKYISSGPHGFREEDFFYVFPIVSLWKPIRPRGVANLDQRGMIGRIYVEYHLTLLHTKYTSFRSCGLREDL